MTVVKNYLNNIQIKKVNELAVVPTLAFMTVPYLIKTAIFAYNKTISKSHKACSGLLPGDKVICMRKFKRDAIVDKLGVLRKALSKCGQTKDPNSCKEKITDQIRTAQFKIKVLNDIMRRTARSAVKNKEIK